MIRRANRIAFGALLVLGIGLLSGFVRSAVAQEGVKFCWGSCNSSGSGCRNSCGCDCPGPGCNASCH